MIDNHILNNLLCVNVWLEVEIFFESKSGKSKSNSNHHVPHFNRCLDLKDKFNSQSLIYWKETFTETFIGLLKVRILFSLVYFIRKLSCPIFFAAFLHSRKLVKLWSHAGNVLVMLWVSLWGRLCLHSCITWSSTWRYLKALFKFLPISFPLSKNLFYFLLSSLSYYGQEL